MRIRFILIFMILVGLLNATIITVDNNPNGIGDFTTLQDAHDSASNGDTLYVYPSGTAYAGITVSKTLSIFGVGFELEANPGYQATPLTSKIDGTITFQAGSENSIIEGINGSTCTVDIETNNILIKRNRLQRISIQSVDGLFGILILNNKITGSGSPPLIYLNTSNSEIYIVNNILIAPIGGSSWYSISLGGSNNTYFITHNVLRGAYAINSNSSNLVTVKNNIIIYGNVGAFTPESIISYNMSNSYQVPAGNGNIRNVNMSTVFVDESSDFHLLTGSPAIGAGENGADMGAYGGDTPFIDGGIPGLPSIYELNSSFVGSQQSGLDVEIKARSNQE